MSILQTLLNNNPENFSFEKQVVSDWVNYEYVKSYIRHYQI